MYIRDIKINGVSEPAGFSMDRPYVSWKVSETLSTEQESTRIGLFSNNSLCWEKEGILDSLGEWIDYPLKPETDYRIKITVKGNQGDQGEGESSLITGKMGQEWQAEWIGTPKGDSFHPVFYRDFQVQRPEEAEDIKLYICGLGLFEAYLNGHKIGDEYLTPYYNNYDKAQQVMTFPVREDLRKENRIEIYLGNGWYKGRFAMNRKEIYGDSFAVIGELHIRYKDGSRDVIQTDGTWRCRRSDIEDSDIYDGEILNRLISENDGMLRYARVLKRDRTKLTDRHSLPVRVQEKLAVKEIIHTPAGETVLDMGQNFTGWLVFHSRLKKGAKVELDFGEVLQEGNFCNANYRTAKSRFVYLSDGREELVRPHFTFYGFRYVRVTGWEGEIRAEDFCGWVLHSDLERTGNFLCSHEKVNRLYENSVWGMKSNFLDMPTDCPQRDERLGWTGDAQVFALTAGLHMDTRAFFDKFLWDLRFYQEEMRGGIPVCIPETGQEHMTSSVWSDIAAIVPWLLYEEYGDMEILQKYFPMMKEWVDYITRGCRDKGEGHYLWDFGFHFGDWLALDGKDEQFCQGGTEEYFIASVYYYNSARLTAQAADALAGRQGILDGDKAQYLQQAEKYRMLAEKIYEAILHEYFTPSGRLALHTQTAYILCLKYKVYVDEEKLIRQFKKRMREDDFEIRSGFVGTPLLCQTLCEHGMEDLACQILLNEKYPGWLYCVNLGATTIWERWNSILPDGTLSGTEMNSLNHYSFGSVAQFLYENIGGIQREEPGYRKVRFAPYITSCFRYVKVSYDSAAGIYEAEWELKENGDVRVRFVVPFGCRAVAKLPRYAGGEIELCAGSFCMTYTPVSSFFIRFHENSLMRELMEDKKAADCLAGKAPELLALCRMGGEDCLEMRLKDALGIACGRMGMRREQADEVLAAVKAL